MRRTTVRGLAAAAMLLLLTLGVPIALFALAGSPIPGDLPTWTEITDALGGSVQLPLLLGVLKYIAWAGWLAFTLSVIAEVAAAARGVKAPRLGPQQRLAAALVAAVAIGLAGPANAAEAPPGQAVVSVATSAEQEPAPPTDSPSAPTAPVAAGQDPNAPPPGYHARTLAEGEILWDIAEEELGDGLRYTEIFTASVGIVQPDGERIERPYLVKAGWTVWIPDQADVAEATTGRTHIVKSGESLWDIAQQELGDGARYPEIFSANAGVTQADGGRLTDPGVIEPGWELRIPGTAPARAAEPAPGADAPLAAVTPLRPPGDEEQSGPEAPLDAPTPLAAFTPLRPAADEQLDGEVPLDVTTPLSPDPSSAPAGDDAAAVEPVDTTTPLDAGPADQPEGPRVTFTDDIEGLTVRLDASGTTSGDVAIASFAWMLGDGRRAVGPALTHTYSSPGEYLVTVTATDEDGATASTSRSITVGPTDPPWGGQDDLGPSTPSAGLPPKSGGAVLPITYDTADLKGNVRHVALDGSDTATGSVQHPYRTLRAAVAASGAGETIVVHGGAYPIEGPVAVTQPGLTIIAGPGELPVFDGSTPAPKSAQVEGGLRWFPYEPLPAREGGGLEIGHLPVATFDAAGNPTGLAKTHGWRCTPDAEGGKSMPGRCPAGQSARITSGLYPDQVWIDDEPLAQVLDKSLVRDGAFFVDRAAGRLYMSTGDAATLDKMRVSSSHGEFLIVAADGVRIEGMRISRHSPDWTAHALRVTSGVDGTTVRNVEFDSIASVAVEIAGGGSSDGSGLVKDAELDQVTIDGSGWMGLSTMYADDLQVTRSRISGSDAAGEFEGAPKRGGVKATKTHGMRVVDSVISGNGGHGLWWDQSSYDTVLANSRITGNRDSAVFYEISHGLPW